MSSGEIVFDTVGIGATRHLTNVAADKHFSDARSARNCWMCLQLN
jgi:hypothetical protein